MSLIDSMPHLATIKVRNRAKDTMGGSKDSFTTVTSDVECWRQKANEKEIVEFQRRGMTVTDKIYFPTDPGIDERHAVVIGNDTMSVRSVANPDASAGKGAIWRVMVEVEDWDT